MEKGEPMVDEVMWCLALCSCRRQVRRSEEYRYMYPNWWVAESAWMLKVLFAGWSRCCEFWWWRDWVLLFGGGGVALSIHLEAW